MMDSHTDLRKGLFWVGFIAALISSCSGAPTLPPTAISLQPVLTSTRGQTPIVPFSPAEDASSEKVYDIALSRDKTRIAVYTSKGIYLYEPFTLARDRFLPVESSQTDDTIYNFAPSIAFTPDGNQLIFSNGNYISRWNLLNLSETETQYVSYSFIPTWNIFKMDYSPQGNRIIVATQGYSAICDSTGVNFALYDLEFNLLFDRYFCTANAESYYRFTMDDKVYVFFNARSMFFPLDFYNVDLVTGNVLEKASYDPYSGHAENFTYDVSEDGQILAIGNYKGYQLTTKIVDVQTGKTLQTAPDGVDLSLAGVGKLRKSKADVAISKKCDLVNKFEAEQYNEIVSDQLKAVYAISEWHSFLDAAQVKALQLWNLTECKIEKEITFY